MTTDPSVLDISHWQSEPPWADLKRAGVIGVILKATEGTTYVDDTYHRRSIDALDYGFIVCSYHFLKHGNVDRQMEHYCNTVEPVEGERVVIDYEDTECNLDDLESAVLWLESTRPDLQVTIYGSAKLTEDATYAKSTSPLIGTDLWIARYSDNPPDIADNIWNQWDLWQYSDTGEVAGWGPVDVNRFNGSDDRLRMWMRPVSVEPVPEPEPPLPRTDVSIDAAPGLRIVVNGFVIDT